MRLKEYLNNNKFLECYIINISENDLHYNDLLEVFCGIIINPLIINDSNHTIILSNEINLDIAQTVDALTDDLGIDLKVFRSNKIYSNNYDFINVLKKAYYKYEKIINENFITIKTLCNTIIEKNIDDLAIIKPILVNKIINDPKLYEIVNGMFINDLNVCKTANYVYMHRNTINNKLTIIKEETGLDIQKFQEAVILYALIKR